MCLVVLRPARVCRRKCIGAPWGLQFGGSNVDPASPPHLVSATYTRLFCILRWLYVPAHSVKQIRVVCTQAGLRRDATVIIMINVHHLQTIPDVVEHSIKTPIGHVKLELTHIKARAHYRNDCDVHISVTLVMRRRQG